MNDSVLEEEQTFSVVLSTADLDITLQSNPAVVTIVDNDGIFANGCCVWFYCLHALMSIWLCYSYILYYIFFFFFSAITVSLQQPMYIVDESIGAVSICAILIGQTEKVVTLTLSPIESTALGNALDS